MAFRICHGSRGTQVSAVRESHTRVPMFGRRRRHTIYSIVRGKTKNTLKKIIAHEPHMVGVVEEINEEIENTPEVRVLTAKLQELFKKSVNLGKQVEVMTIMRLVGGIVEPVELTDQIASMLEISVAEKQKLLEELNLSKRLNKTLELMAKEVSAFEVEHTISTKTQKRFDENIRRNMLQEKKRVIEKELGEISGDGEFSGEEIKEYREKIKASGMPSDVAAKAEKELKKLSQMSPYNPEGGYLRNYLDWLTDMPWNKVTPNNVSIKDAGKVLEDNHYGMEKAKDRILEYLAVMKLRGHAQELEKKEEINRPTILCFIGPPGVGKTSVGRSIAKALGREFVRVSLGGIRDEAEIRGHRRTYIGALPGRIIQGIRNAKTKNPVFMLDEIDKVGTDFRGDPTSALLEALDPEQNREFSDHYLEVPFDLSQVMFIATGNLIDTIPSALRDRMEVINLQSYTESEKFFIAKKFLWPKVLKVNGLNDKKLKITDLAVREVISKYTREAGVRNLERSLSALCRKVARLIAEKKKYPKKIQLDDVHKFLGTRKFNSQIAEKEDEVGMATGLSVTPFGGEILSIEVSLMPGRGKLLLTGQLGSVMQESAKAAFTWTRSHYRDLGLKENFAEKIDVHIHVPEGAVPKDGPSAGTAITTALVSALTGMPIRKDVGMTGEVTLRGRVLEIGGVKEKTIAGHRAGLKTIILPKENKKDLEDVPATVKKDIKFVFASVVEDALEVAVNGWKARKQVAREFTPLYSVLAAN